MVQFRLDGLVCLGALLCSVACAESDADGSNASTVDAGTDADDEPATANGEQGDDDSDGEPNATRGDDDTADDEEPAADIDDDTSADEDENADDDTSADEDDRGDDDTADDIEPDTDSETDADVDAGAEQVADDDTADDESVEEAMDPEADDESVDAGAPEDEDPITIGGDDPPEGDAGAPGELVCADIPRGEDCEGCVRGSVSDGEGGCVEACALLDCGANGGCVPLQESEVMCGCDDGYAGDLCDTCAPGFQMIFRGDVGGCMLIVPESDDMVLWLDADHDASFDIGPAGNVTAWRSRAGDETAFTAAGLVSGRPSRVEVGGRDWVHFDGEDDRLQRAVDLSSGSYSIFMVVQSGDGAIDQTLLSGVQESSEDPGLRLVVRDGGQTVMVRHQMPFGDEYDEVSFEDFDLTRPGIVEVNRNPGILNLLALGNGESASSVPSSTPEFGEELVLRIGGLHNGGIPYALDGDVAELIIVSPAISSTSEAAAMRTYLEAKWQL